MFEFHLLILYMDFSNLEAIKRKKRKHFFHFRKSAEKCREAIFIAGAILGAPYVDHRKS
jgi:hypothetical protein